MGDVHNMYTSSWNNHHRLRVTIVFQRQYSFTIFAIAFEIFTSAILHQNIVQDTICIYNIIIISIKLHFQSMNINHVHTHPMHSLHAT